MTRPLDSRSVPAAFGRRQLAALALAALALVTAPLAPGPPPARAADEPRRALARLDSLLQVVFAEEARVQQDPRAEGYWARLARAWYQLGNHARAVQALEQARMLGAREYDTCLLLGRAARSEMRLGEARRWLERAARIGPDGWEAREDIGLTLYLEGRLPEAAAQWRRAGALPGTGSPPRAGLLEAMESAGAGAYEITGPGRERLPFATPAGTARALPGVAVRVNGRGPFLLRIEPGVSEVVLEPRLAEELGLSILSGGAEGPFAGGGSARRDYAVLDSLQLGSTTIHRLPIAVGGVSSGFRGSLGLEVLRRFRFCIDYPAGALHLEPPGPDSVPAWIHPGDVAHAVPILLRGTHLLVAYGTLGRGPERPFLVDTGAVGVGFAAPLSTLVESLIPVDTTRALEGTSAGGTVRYHPIAAARLCLGEVCSDSVGGVYGIFPESLELNPSFRIAGMVSHGFVSRYRYGVDLRQRRAWLVSPSGGSGAR